ncbi:MAG: phosphonate C-P lyase system protein PhnH [Betaproteobacteria bacterium]|nr:MAG: phosphonate C-P lyase system protein PhnH [Betaproteobacteria bacterium]
MNGLTPIDLSTIGRGFDNLALDSQAVFRLALSAMSRPGDIQELTAGIESPAGLHPAAGAVLLALLDQDTRLWLSPAFAGGHVSTYLRFHTGCVLVADAAEADFVLVANVSELPALCALSLGSEEYPERSATVVLQVEELSNSAGWPLSGPGIEGAKVLRIEGLDEGFVTQWRQAQAEFPRGVDLFAASAGSLAALPRTTRLEA